VISVKNRKIFPPHVYFATPQTGSPCNWVSALRVKKLEWWCYRTEREVWRFLQLSGYNTPRCETDGQTNRRTPGDSKDRLCI